MSDFSRFKPTSSTLFKEPATIQNSDFDKRTSNIPVTVRGDGTYGTYRNYSDGTTQGRYLISSVVFTSPVALTTATQTTICSLTIPRGKWDLRGAVGFTPAATTVINRLVGSISKTSNTSPATSTIAVPTDGEVVERISFGAITPGANLPTAFTLDGGIVDITESERTYYMVAFGVFTISTLDGFGSLYAVSVL